MSGPLAWLGVAGAQPGDPYLDWSLATGWVGQPPSRLPLWVPLLAPRGAAWDAVLATWGAKGQAHPSPWNPPDTDWGVLWVRADAVAAAAQQLPGCEMSQPLPYPGPPGPAPALPPPAQTPPPVVVAAIDRGGAVLNACFGHRDDPTRTRLLGYWDQAERATVDAWQAAAAGYGRELNPTTLNALLQRAQQDPDGELGVYRDLGLGDLLQAHALGQPEHATHVLDTLAGLPPVQPCAASAKPRQDDPASRAPLVLVSVPPSRIGQTTGTATVAQVLDGLHYILALAEAHAPGVPVVVNISLGLLAGPHDGSSALERAIDGLMRRRPHLLVVLAAGNNGGDRLVDPGKGTNASGRLAPGDTATLTWRLQPGDPTDSFLELWWHTLGKTAADLRLRVVYPVAGEEVPLNHQQDLRAGDALVGRLHSQALGALGQDHEARGQLSLGPVGGPRGALPAGRWVLALRNAGPEPLEVDARVQGDLPRWNEPEPVQSVLSESSGLSLGEAGSLNGLATGQLPMVVGAARQSDGSDTLYTSRPKSRGTQRQRERVDARAVADEGAFAPGLVASGVLSGSWVRMGGTSVAAPVAARHWANRLSRGRLPDSPEQWLDFLQPPALTKGGPATRSRGEAERGDAPPAPRQPPPIRPD